MASLIDKYYPPGEPVTTRISKSSGSLLDKYYPKKEEPAPIPKISFSDRLKQVATGAGKLLARTGVEASNVLTSTLDFFADAAATSISKKIEEPLLGISGINKPTDGQKVLADKWKSFYSGTAGPVTQKMKEFTQGLRKIEYIQPSEEFRNSSIQDNITKRPLETVLNIGPGLISSLGMYAINPVLGVATTIGSTADDVKTIAVERGVDEERATLLGAGTGILVSWLDKIVPDEVFSPEQKKQFISGFATRTAKLALKEAGTEAAQEDIQLLAEATVREDITADEVIQRNLTAALGGLLGGAGANVSVTFVNSIRNGDIAGIDIKSLPEVDENVETQPTSGALEPLSIEAAKYQSASDFAEIQGTNENSQIGVLPANQIEVRDSVDTTTQDYIDLKADIEQNGIKEPVIVTVDKNKATTFEGSHRVTIARELNIDVPVIVTQGNLDGFQTISEFYEQSKSGLEEQAVNTSAEPVPELIETEVITKKIDTSVKLPNQLARAKPRYNFGKKAFIPKFESDVDLALYITAQTNKSARDSEYRQYLLDRGFSQEQINSEGQKLRNTIKEQARVLPGGDYPNPQEIKVSKRDITFRETVNKKVEQKSKKETKPEKKPKSPKRADKLVEKETTVPLDKVKSSLPDEFLSKVNRKTDKIIALEESIKKGDQLPAIPVYKENGQYFTNKDGDNRLIAYQNVGVKDISVRIEGKTTLAPDVKQKQEREKANKSIKRDTTPAKKSAKPEEETIKKEPTIKEITQKQVEAVKDIKTVKSTLKDIRTELEQAVVEAEALATIASEQRAGINTDDVAKLKRIISVNKKFQDGDIETLRSSDKVRDLANRVIENVQEVRPAMSEDEAFEFAKNLPTKAQEQPRNQAIKELEKKEKKLSKYLEQLRAKQEELRILEDDALSKEWQRALAVQENLISIIRVPGTQLPVGEGKVKLSRLEARMRGMLDNASQEQIDDLGLATYNQVKNKENVASAAEYVVNNPDEAIRIIKGEIEPPAGILRNSIYVALKNLGTADTDLATRIASLAATRYGQEISVLQEIAKDNPVTMMEEVVRTRIEAFEKKTGGKMAERIKAEIKKIDAELKAPSARTWDSFLNSIVC